MKAVLLSLYGFLLRGKAEEPAQPAFEPRRGGIPVYTPFDCPPMAGAGARKHPEDGGKA